VRRLEVGQVCYVYRGGVTFLQIKRLTGRQAAIGRGPGPGAHAPGGAEPATVPLPVAAARPAPWPPPGPALPDASEVLDEAFGELREG
jgi:hypothetical protein